MEVIYVFVIEELVGGNDRCSRKAAPCVYVEGREIPSTCVKTFQFKPAPARVFEKFVCRVTILLVILCGSVDVVSFLEAKFMQLVLT